MCQSRGKLLHYLVVVDGFESDWAIIATLIFLYAECGYMIEVHKVFHSLPSPDLATWSVLIAHCGSMDLTRQLFTSMKQQNLNPNAQLFTNILTACAREGLLEEGVSYFEIMREGDGIGLNLWHFTSVANLLSRTGHTKDAYDLLQALPMPPDEAIWRALLSGCKLHEDVSLGERSFDHGINGIDGNVISKDTLSKEVLLSKQIEKSEVTTNGQVYWEIGRREKSEEQYSIIEELYILKQKNSLIQTLE
ncbi:hypothetical protein L7F22_007365 [Adiantum nelumboides]|nr:hypothetical protein [Adiantum nelumboides]